MVYILLLAGVGYIDQQTQLERCRAPQMAHGLPLLPAVEGQGEVYWLVLLIWCKQNANLLMVTSATALLLVRHLCSCPGEWGAGGARRRETNRKGEFAALSSLLTRRPWSALGAIHNNTQAGHYMRDTTDDSKQTNQQQRSTESSQPYPEGEVKGQNSMSENVDPS